MDGKSCAPSGTPGPADQRIGTGDGATTAFQLVKTYGAGYAPYARPIAKPVAAQKAAPAILHKPGNGNGRDHYADYGSF